MVNIKIKESVLDIIMGVFFIFGLFCLVGAFSMKQIEESNCNSSPLIKPIDKKNSSQIITTPQGKMLFKYGEENIYITPKGELRQNIGGGMFLDPTTGKIENTNDWNIKKQNNINSW